MSLRREDNRCLSCCKKFTTLRKVISILSQIAILARNIGLKSLLIAISLLNSSATPNNYRSGSKLRMIVIDPGHGGFDPGTVGKNSKEKDVALKISLKL